MGSDTNTKSNINTKTNTNTITNTNKNTITNTSTKMNTRKIEKLQKIWVKWKSDGKHSGVAEAGGSQSAGQPLTLYLISAAEVSELLLCAQKHCLHI